MTRRDPEVDAVVRLHAPRVLAALLRRGFGLDACESAVHGAVASAYAHWTGIAVPSDPSGWILATAARNLPGAAGPGSIADVGPDDSLRLLVYCCHPALSETSQIALTLRAVGGLTTAQIARAFLAGDAAMAERITRAKHTIEASGPAFVDLSEADRVARLPAVLHVLHLVFTEGQIVSPDLSNVHLADEAIRLTRLAAAELPSNGELRGLLGVMLLTEARRPARVNAAGEFVPLAEQDRTLWRGELISEGLELSSRTPATGAPGQYGLLAAIAAVHAAARSAADTDWGELLRLHDLLIALAPDSTNEVNRAIAVGEVHGAEHGLRLLDALGHGQPLAQQARFLTVRAMLLERAGRASEARAEFAAAARVAGNDAERRYLERRAAPP